MFCSFFILSGVQDSPSNVSLSSHVKLIVQRELFDLGVELTYRVVDVLNLLSGRTPNVRHDRVLVFLAQNVIILCSGRDSQGTVLGYCEKALLRTNAVHMVVKHYRES